ncbi:SUMF1/EgtB/PvdO family nonheme iron enzyme [Burkholderia lata]|uniref:SUMF1/EgtB/PvdO family nonheme iron enzyme n=2 Tax=Burkholderia cepacia complex TaxID=87882 RepID=UPI003204A4EE
MEYLRETLDLPMVQVPAGTIAMRDDRIGRTWCVDLQRFAIGRYPVTQAQYAAVTGQSPSSRVSAQCPVWVARHEVRDSRISWQRGATKPTRMQACPLLSRSGHRSCGAASKRAGSVTRDGTRSEPVARAW